MGLFLFIMPAQVRHITTGGFSLSGFSIVSLLCALQCRCFCFCSLALITFNQVLGHGGEWGRIVWIFCRCFGLVCWALFLIWEMGGIHYYYYYCYCYKQYSDIYSIAAFRESERTVKGLRLDGGWGGGVYNRKVFGVLGCKRGGEVYVVIPSKSKDSRIFLCFCGYLRDCYLSNYRSSFGVQTNPVIGWSIARLLHVPRLTALLLVYIPW